MKKKVLFLTLILLVLFSIHSGNAEEGVKDLFDKELKWFFESYRYDYVTQNTDTVISTTIFDGPHEFEGKLCYTIGNIPEGIEDYLKPYYWKDGLCLYRRETVYGKKLTYNWNLVFDEGIEAGQGDCVKEDVIQVNGITRRRWWLVDDIWVEGIGSYKYGPFGDGWTESGSYRGGCCIAVYDGDKCIFTKEDFTKEAVTAPKPIYNTFVVEGKRWNCVHTNANPASEPTQFSYFMQGDTVIGGQVCKKMFVEGLYGDKPDYYAAFYEKNGKVFRYYKDRETAELIFDHVRQAGDKGTFFGQEHEVIRIDTLENQGRKFRVLYLYNGVPNISGITIVVDGLGGDISNMFYPGALGGGANSLATCEQNGEVIYSAADINNFVYGEVISKWFFDWLEKQISGIREPQSSTASDFISPLYDLQGRRLSSAPRKGVYVRDGKKFVKR